MFSIKPEQLVQFEPANDAIASLGRWKVGILCNN